jgi:protein-tyrosine kinase
LRTQVLQAMDAKEWRFLGITSPTPGCGKTVVAVNLALSIARLSERSVLLMDLDLRKPQVASHLGLKPQYGVVSTLQNRSSLSEAIMPTRIGDYRMAVLPTEARISSSSDWMASGAMTDLFQQIEVQCQSQIILVDLPPLLSSDDVLAILPKLDCVLLVTAVGITTIPQINESKNLLHSTELVKVVLNKAPPSKTAYYY